jgi:DnaB-like helicase N terminal domain/AAA domain
VFAFHSPGPRVGVGELVATKNRRKPSPIDARFFRNAFRPSVSEPLERPLPANIEAERSILGAILLDNNAIKLVIEKLKPEEFFHDHHRHIYQQMLALGETHQAIDLVTLAEQLQRTGELESVGGAPYISQLMDGVPHLTNVEFYVRIVREKALLRGLIHATNAIYQQAFEAEDDAAAILDRAESSISCLKATHQKSSLKIFTASELVALVQEPLEYVAYPFAVRGAVALLDGAAKAAGKTTLILTAVGAASRRELFLNHATMPVPVLYVTEENPRTFRWALDRAGLNSARELHIIPFTIFAGVPWPQLAQRIERVCAELKIGWLIIDTFHAVAGLGGEEENKAGVVDEAVAPLRAIAGRLDIAVTLSRHERKSGGEVGNSGRGSSALTGAADIVLLLKRLPGNRTLGRRQLEITGRIEQARFTIELRDRKYFIVDEKMEDLEKETARLNQVIAANPAASKRQLEEETGIGRNRVEKVAALAGWHYGDSGWERRAS